MSDFSTEAEVSIVVPQRELRSARQEVEDALAEIPVGVSASAGGGAGGGATNAAREQRRRRREFRWARQRTDDTEAQLEILENIEGELTEGGLGGGGGITGELIGLGGDTAGIATDIGSTLVEALPSALGSLVGTAVGQRFDGGGGGGGGQTVSRDILSPEITVDPTIQPEFTNTFSPTFSPTFEPDFNPEFSPTFEPDINPEFNPTFEPEFNPTLEPKLDILSGLEELNLGGGDGGLSEPVDVIVTNFSEQQNIEPTANRGGGQTRGGIQRLGAALDNFGVGVAERFLPGEAPPSVSQPLGRGGTFAGRPFETLGRGFDTVNPFTRGGFASGNSGGGGGASVNASTGNVNITVNADVQSTVQSVIDELRREQERQRQELRNDLERQISDLEGQIRSGGRGGVTGL